MQTRSEPFVIKCNESSVVKAIVPKAVFGICCMLSNIAAVKFQIIIYHASGHQCMFTCICVHDTMRPISAE